MNPVMEGEQAVKLRPDDALIVVDVQNDFLPGGSLAVSGGDEIVPILNRYIDLFLARDLPVVATRDWHPADHCSFTAQGGPWPPHCIADSTGAAFAATLELPAETRIVSKATGRERDAYSGFQDTGLADWLRARQVRRLLVGGLATDYCVLNTVKDGLAAGFAVVLLKDAIRAVNVQALDGQRAIEEMTGLGAVETDLRQLATD